MFQHHPAQDPRAGEQGWCRKETPASSQVFILLPTVSCSLESASRDRLLASRAAAVREPLPVGSTMERQHPGPPAIICGWLPSASPDCLTQPRPPPMASRSRVRKTVPCYGPQINPFYLAIPGEKEKPVAESVCLSVPRKGNRSKYVNYRHEVPWETTCRH